MKTLINFAEPTSFFGLVGGTGVGLCSGFVVITSEESCFKVWVRFLLASASARVSSFGFLDGGS